jgi:hypothetical protein
VSNMPTPSRRRAEKEHLERCLGVLVILASLAWLKRASATEVQPPRQSTPSTNKTKANLRDLGLSMAIISRYGPGQHVLRLIHFPRRPPCERGDLSLRGGPRRVGGWIPHLTVPDGGAQGVVVGPAWQERNRP